MNPKYLEEHAMFVYLQLMQRLGVGFSEGTMFEMDFGDDE